MTSIDLFCAFEIGELLIIGSLQIFVGNRITYFLRQIRIAKRLQLQEFHLLLEIGILIESILPRSLGKQLHVNDGIKQQLPPLRRWKPLQFLA